MLLSTNSSGNCSICDHPETIFVLNDLENGIFRFCARKECKPHVELHQTEQKVPLFVEINVGWRV